MAIHDFRGAVEKQLTNASIIRETDVMRQGVGAKILNIESGIVILVTEEELKVGEAVKVELRNTVQRYSRMVRGEVTSVRQHRGDYTIEFMLHNRLTPHDVQTLRMQIRSAAANTWI